MMDDPKSLAEKYKEVDTWLKRVLPDGNHNYEITNSTVNTLLKLKRRNETKDAAVRTVIRDLKQKSEEYESQSKKTSNILAGLSLTPERLGNQTAELLSSLANLMVTLGVQDTSNDASLHIELYNLLQTLESTSEFTGSNAAINAKTISATVQLAKIERISQSVDMDVKSHCQQAARKEKNCEWLTLKIEDYKKRSEKFMEELKNNGFSASFTHERVSQKHQELLALQQQVFSLQEKVDSFHNLPSSVPLASIKLSEAKAELEVIRQELKSNIDEIE